MTIGQQTKYPPRGTMTKLPKKPQGFLANLQEQAQQAIEETGQFLVEAPTKAYNAYRQQLLSGAQAVAKSQGNEKAVKAITQEKKKIEQQNQNLTNAFNQQQNQQRVQRAEKREEKQQFKSIEKNVKTTQQETKPVLDEITAYINSTSLSPEEKKAYLERLNSRHKETLSSIAQERLEKTLGPATDNIDRTVKIAKLKQAAGLENKELEEKERLALERTGGTNILKTIWESPGRLVDSAKDALGGYVVDPFRQGVETLSKGQLNVPQEALASPEAYEKHIRTQVGAAQLVRQRLGLPSNMEAEVQEQLKRFPYEKAILAKQVKEQRQTARKEDLGKTQNELKARMEAEFGPGAYERYLEQGSTITGRLLGEEVLPFIATSAVTGGAGALGKGLIGAGRTVQGIKGAGAVGKGVEATGKILKGGSDLANRANVLNKIKNPVVREAAENALQEVGIGTIQEFGAAGRGEKTTGEALLNLAGRTALAGGIGAGVGKIQKEVRGAQAVAKRQRQLTERQRQLTTPETTNKILPETTNEVLPTEGTTRIAREAQETTDEVLPTGSPSKNYQDTTGVDDAAAIERAQAFKDLGGNLNLREIGDTFKAQGLEEEAAAMYRKADEIEAILSKKTGVSSSATDSGIVEQAKVLDDEMKGKPIDIARAVEEASPQQTPAIKQYTSEQQKLINEATSLREKANFYKETGLEEKADSFLKKAEKLEKKVNKPGKLPPEIQPFIAEIKKTKKPEDLARYRKFITEKPENLNLTPEFQTRLLSEIDQKQKYLQSRQSFKSILSGETPRISLGEAAAEVPPTTGKVGTVVLEKPSTAGNIISAIFKDGKKIVTKPAELGVKEVDIKGIRRSLGDFSPKEFQKEFRDAAKLQQLTSNSNYKQILPPDTESIVDVISNTARSKKIAEHEFDNLTEALFKKLRESGQDRIEVEVPDGKGGTKKVTLNPVKLEDKLVLNEAGEKSLQEIKAALVKKGEGIYRQGKGAATLNVQPNLKLESKVDEFMKLPVEDIAKRLVASKENVLNLTQKFEMSKGPFVRDIMPNLKTEAFDHSFTNSTKDTSLWTSRPKSTLISGEEGKALKELEAAEATGDTEKILAARQKVLRAKQATEKLQEKIKTEKGSLLKFKELSYTKKGQITESNIGRSIAERGRAKVQRAEKLATELNQELATKEADRIIKNGVETPEDVTKVNNIAQKLKKRFAIDPVMGTIALKVFLNGLQADPVGVLFGGLRAMGGFTKIAGKISKGGKISKSIYEAAEVADAFTGMSRSIETRILDTGNPKAIEFLQRYKKLAGEEFVFRTNMNDSFISKELTSEESSKISEFLSEKTSKEIEEILEKPTKEFRELLSPKAQAYLEIANDLQKARLSLTKKIRKAGLSPEINEVFDSLITLDETITTPFRTISDIATRIQYSVILGNRVSSLLTLLTDVPVKTLSEFGPSATGRALFDIFKPKVRNSKLFKTLSAGQIGTGWGKLAGQATDSLKQKNPLADFLFRKIPETAEKTNLFKNFAEFTQDVSLLAKVRRFEADYLKKTGKKIDIFKEFDGKSAISKEFLIETNESLNDLYNAGIGSLSKTGTSKNALFKPFAFLQSEAIRFQHLDQRDIQMITKGTPEQRAIAIKTYALRKLATTLMGGTAIVSSIPIANTVLNAMPPDTRENFLEGIETLNLAKYMGLNYNSKLGTSLINPRPGQKTGEAIQEYFSEAGGNPLLEFTQREVKTLTDGYKLIKEKEYGPGMLKIASAIPYVSGLSDALRRIGEAKTGEAIPVWVKNKGSLGKEFVKADYKRVVGPTMLQANLQRKADLMGEAVSLAQDLYRNPSNTNKEEQLDKIVDVLMRPKFYENDPPVFEMLSQSGDSAEKIAFAKNLREEIVKKAETKEKGRQKSQEKKFSSDRVEYWTSAPGKEIDARSKVAPDKTLQMIDKTLQSPQLKLTRQRRKLLENTKKNILIFKNRKNSFNLNLQPA